MGMFFRKPTPAIPEFTGLQVQTSVNTLPIPIIYGTPRASGNLIYATNFYSVGNKNTQGGGKGLLSSGKNANTSYTYFATLIMAIGEGPLGDVLVIFQDQQVFTLTNEPSMAWIYFDGAANQAPWSYVVENWPADARSYARTAYLAGPNYPLDSSGTVPQFNFLIAGILQGTCPLYRCTETIANPSTPGYSTVTVNLDMDADPALVIADFLTNAQYGVPGFPASLLDPDTFYSTGNASNLAVGNNCFQTYCQAAGFGFSSILNNSEQASSILERWAKLLGVAVVWTGAILKFIPYWDTPTQANPGYDLGNEMMIPRKYFVPVTTALFSLTDDDYVQTKDNQDPVTYERIDTADVYNTVRLDFNDRTNLWNSNVSEAKDENDIELNGIRVDQLSSANEFSLEAFASNSAQVIVQRNTSVRNKYTFKLSWEFCVLDPMDIVQISDANLGLSSLPVRIVSIEEDDHFELTVIAEEFPIGAASPVTYPKQPYGGSVYNTNFPPQLVNTPFFFEPTQQLIQSQVLSTSGITTPVIVIGLSAGPNGAFDQNFGGAQVYVSLDNITYSLLGAFTGVSTMGVTTASLSAYGGPNPDTVDTLAVDMTESDSTLDSVDPASAAAGLSLCALNDGNKVEILGYTTATLTGPNQYSLTGLYRGLYGTSAASFASGTQFLYLQDKRWFEAVLPQQYVGQTLYLKFPAFNIYHLAEQPFDVLVTYEYVPTGSGVVPLPGNCFTQSLGASPDDLGDPSQLKTCSFDLGVTTAIASGLGPYDLGVA